eukprot:403359429
MNIKLKGLKEEEKRLTHEISRFDVEIQKAKEKQDKYAKEQCRINLRDTLKVIKNLKKQVGNGNYDEEYQELMEEVQRMQKSLEMQQSDKQQQQQDLSMLEQRQLSTIKSQSNHKRQGSQESQKSSIVQDQQSQENVNEKGPFKNSHQDALQQYQNQSNSFIPTPNNNNLETSSNKNDRTTKNNSQLSNKPSKQKMTYLEQQALDIAELEKKIKNIEDEISLNPREFEQKLAQKLGEEIEVNKRRIDEEFKRKFLEDKAKIIKQAQKEKEELKQENGRLAMERDRIREMLKV